MWYCLVHDADGTDFIAQSGMLHFDESNTEQPSCLSVMIINDAEIEGLESFSCQLFSDDPAVNFNTANTTINIVDDDDDGKRQQNYLNTYIHAPIQLVP